MFLRGVGRGGVTSTFPPWVPEGGVTGLQGGVKFFGMFSKKRVEFWIQTCYSGIRGLKSVFWAKATQNLKIFWILINKRETWKKKSGKKVGDSERLNIDKIFCNLKELYTSGTTLSEMINWTPLSNELRGKIRFGPPPPWKSWKKLLSVRFLEGPVRILEGPAHFGRSRSHFGRSRSHSGRSWTFQKANGTFQKANGTF